MTMHTSYSILANTLFTGDMIDKQGIMYLDKYYYIPFNYYNTPHKELQKLYKYIKQVVDGNLINFTYGCEMWSVGLFIPYKCDIYHFSGFKCSAFKFRWDRIGVEWFIDQTIIHPELLVDITLEPMERLDLASSLIDSCDMRLESAN